MIPDEDRRLRLPLFPTMPPPGMATAGPDAGPPISGPALSFTRSLAPAPAGDGSGEPFDGLKTAAETAPVSPSPQIEVSGAVAIHVSPAMAVLISTIAIHDDCSVGQLIGRLAARRADEIGLGVLAREVADRDEADGNPRGVL